MFGFGLLKGLFITLKNLIGPVFTIQYPSKRIGLFRALNYHKQSPISFMRNQPKEFIQRYENKTPLLRMGTENDIVGMVAFLSSDISSYITGQNIIIDGGRTII